MKPLCENVAFTLVEILASLAFLGILLPVLISALLAANRAGIAAERSATAARLGENQLGEWMVADGWTTASSRGDFGPQWPGYRWELKQADWESGSMVELSLDLFFQVQGRERSIRLGTLVNRSLSTSGTATTTGTAAP